MLMIISIRRTSLPAGHHNINSAIEFRIEILITSSKTRIHVLDAIITLFKRYELARSRTWNLLIRSQTRYPLRHKACRYLNW